MMRYLLALIAVVFSFSGCSPSREPMPQLTEKEQIGEAVFRYQFEFNASGLGKTASAYFLSVEGGEDPSAQLLKQFDGNHPPVKPVSASVLEAGTAQVLDRESGSPGLIFSIEEIRWLSANEVEVEGGYEEASESGAGTVYYLERERERWRVIKSEMLWIK